MFSSKIYPQDLPHYYGYNVPVKDGYYYVAVYDPSLKGYTEEIGYLHGHWFIGTSFVDTSELLLSYKKHRIYRFGPSVFTPQQANILNNHIDSCKDVTYLFE